MGSRQRTSDSVPYARRVISERNARTRCSTSGLVPSTMISVGPSARAPSWGESAIFRESAPARPVANDNAAASKVQHAESRAVLKLSGGKSQVWSATEGSLAVAIPKCISTTPPVFDKKYRPAQENATSRHDRPDLSSHAGDGQRSHCLGYCSPVIQHCLYFFPLPHGHGSLRPIFGWLRTNG